MNMNSNPVIDSHCHLGRMEHWNEELLDGWFGTFGLPNETADIDPDKVIENMDAAGVDKTAVLAFDCKRHLGVHIPNNYVAEQVRKYDGRLFGFASVDPLDRSGPAELKRAVEKLGLVGLKVAPTYQNADPSDPRAMAVFQAASDLGIPVLIHQGWTGNIEAVSTLQDVASLEAVLSAFPELRMIVAHVGMPANRECLHLLAKYEHAYADLAARDLDSFGGGVRTIYSDIADAVDLGVEHKIFWGTDNPWRVPKESLEALDTVNEWAVGGRAPIGDDVLLRIKGQNMADMMAGLGRDLF